MATLLPIQAVRYNLKKVNGPLASVVAPPYDVISLEDQDNLYKKSPHNVIRLILSRQYDGDGPGDNRYTRAANTLQTWMDQEVLTEDPQPVYYVYEQTFETPSAKSGQVKKWVRRGVIGALRLEPFGQGCVYPHEETFSAPKADRLNLIRACRANLSQVFGLIPDADKSMVTLLERAIAKAKPCAEVREENGVLNKMWAIDDPAFGSTLSDLLSSRKVFIADGHHRYETACAYRDERRKNDSNPGIKRERAYDSVLMMCVPMNDPGLNILPTHRLIHAAPGFSGEQFLSKTAELFENQPADEQRLIQLAEEESGALRFGVVLAGGKKLLLTAKPGVEAAMSKVAEGKSPAWRSLDVAVLHELILKGMLGIGESGVPHKQGVTYTKDPAEVFAGLASPGTFDIGFILRPTRIDQVQAVAENGEKMPHKSTYFYPKLLSGLIIRKL